MQEKSHSEPLKNIVIVGGGSAGWMTAAALSKSLDQSHYTIRLIESESIGTVSVGEATIPQIRNFNAMLGIDEDDFIKFTQGTFKLGIEFVNWQKQGHAYMHPFGDYGTSMNGIPFHHYWLKRQKINSSDDLLDYCLEGYAAKRNLFTRPLNIPKTPLATINYAFHFDANLYSKYLKIYAERFGVIRKEGTVEQVTLHSESGHIESLKLTSGDIIEGDLFIDCTGFKGLLIEKSMKSEFEDWSHWLPCNSAVAQISEAEDVIKTYTVSTAHTAGWQWQIPLQSRMGNGHVYASDFMDQDEAAAILQKHLPTKAIREPKFLYWRNGKRKHPWIKNCVAIGLSAGFLEPLESTGLQLIQAAIERLLSLFPNKSFHQQDIDSFNQHTDREIKQIRDFIILHYKLTQRSDSPFWNYCREMSIPESLQTKIDLYKSNGRIFRDNYELFSEFSWLSVLNGQGLIPEGYHPLVDSTSEENLHFQLDQMKAIVAECSKNIPTHRDYINQHCKAPFSQSKQ